MGRIVGYGLLLALLATACAGAGTTPNILHVQAGPSGVSSKQVEVNDKFLARALTFGDVSVKALAAGSSIEAQVIVKNERDQDVMFEYRFLWYDVSGYELSSVTSWMPAMLTGKEARGFKSTAPGPNAAGFKLMVRQPHPVTSTGS
jgi:uncharacterized protein YcfL